MYFVFGPENWRYFFCYSLLHTQTQRKQALRFLFLSGLEEHCCDPSPALARINKGGELKIDFL